MEHPSAMFFTFQNRGVDPHGVLGLIVGRRSSPAKPPRKAGTRPIKAAGRQTEADDRPN
jgi:hypothetical protein